jgi:hypothetical protein
VSVNQGSGILAPALSTLGGLLGNAVAPGIGGVVGAGLGGLAGQAITHFTGFGDYEVKKNSILYSDPIPVLNNEHKHGGIIISNREYIGDVITGPANSFDITQYDINPALLSTFPLLSEIASSFEQYSLEGMLFEFRTMSADALNSTNTALGQVICATNYNAASPAFLSKAQMENYEFGQSCKPSISMYHPIECEKNQSFGNVLYCRTGAVPAGQDQRLYDWGKFQIATNGFQAANVNVGELWVTYQVRLLKPKLHQALGESVLWSNHYATVGLANNRPLGTNMIPAIGNTLSLSFDYTAGAQTITLPYSTVTQSFVLTWNIRGSGTALIGYITPTLTNAIPAQVFDGRAQSYEDSPFPGLASSVCMFRYAFQTVPSKAAVLTWTGSGVFPTGPQLANLYIHQIPNSAVPSPSSSPATSTIEDVPSDVPADNYKLNSNRPYGR